MWTNKKFFCFLGYFLTFPLFSYAQNNVATTCQSYDGNELIFLQKISSDILSEPSLRSELIQGLKANHLPGCKHALTDYMVGILKNPNPKYRRGMQVYLPLALVADIPAARQLVSSEIDQGRLSDFIDVLKETDEKAYDQALSQWLEKVAAAVRSASNANQQDISKYGKAQNTELKEEKNLSIVSIWSPLYMDRYLQNALQKKEKLDQKQFSELNVIFALANGSYRGIFLNQFVSLIKLNTQQWMSSFRTEQPWVQFRLFPLLQKQTDNGLVKRELIWLAQYHQDARIRSLAQDTLDHSAFSGRVATKF